MLSDNAIHGTKRHHFEIHDLTDISGGRWKAVHIPDEDISSMLKLANAKKGGNLPMDIKHEEPSSQKDEESGVQMPVEVHGHVQAFEHNLMKNESKNSTAPVGKLFVATDNEHRGKEVGELHPVHPTEINLKGYMKEEGPKNREMIHRKELSKPSLVVAKIPEDDDEDDSDDLPIRRLPKPIVAPLRKTRPRIKPGSFRSDILAGTINPEKTPAATSDASKNPTKSSETQDTDPSQNKQAIPEKTDEAVVLKKIKSLLLASSHKTAQPSAKKNSPPKKETTTASQGTSHDAHPSLPASKPANVSPTSKISPTLHPNNDGLFLPADFPRPTNAFSNHESVLDRISEPKREALLVGIIKALLARDKVKTFGSSPNAMMTGAAAALPHYNRQAILQGLQNLQMPKTVGTQGNEAGMPGDLATANAAATGKDLEEVYQKEREVEVKQELGR